MISSLTSVYQTSSSTTCAIPPLSNLFSINFITVNLFSIKGGHPDLFVKLVFGKAVVQLTRNHDKTFEGVVDPNRLAHHCPQCSHALIWSNFGPIIPNHLNRGELWGIFKNQKQFRHSPKFPKITKIPPMP